MAKGKIGLFARLLFALLGLLVAFSFLALLHGGPAKTYAWLKDILADLMKSVGIFR